MKIYRISQVLNLANIPPQGNQYQVYDSGTDAIGAYALEGKYFMTPDGRWVTAEEEHEDAAREMLEKAGLAPDWNSSEIAKGNEILAGQGWLRINEDVGGWDGQKYVHHLYVSWNYPNHRQMQSLRETTGSMYTVIFDRPGGGEGVVLFSPDDTL